MGILRARKHRLAYRIMAGFPDAVIAVSEQVRRQCIEMDGIDPDRVQTIYNGLNMTDWATPSRRIKAQGEIVVASVGNIRRVKGYDIMIKAAALIAPHFPNVSFSIAGEVLEPDYYAELQSLIHSLNLSDRFHFAGGVTDLKQYLCAADIFVLPSHSEGFSNAIVEAMAASLPVIASDVGGNAEAIKNGVSGLLVPPDDPEKLSAAITALLTNPAQAISMGLAGNALAAEYFTIEAMMSRIVSIYDKLLAAE
jgi:glycosyltransferase involved in cell wall biosynthesis